MNARSVLGFCLPRLSYAGLFSILLAPSLLLAEPHLPVAQFNGHINSQAEGANVHVSGYLKIEKVESKNYRLELWRWNREGLPKKILGGFLEGHTDSFVWRTHGGDPIRLDKNGRCWQSREETAQTLRICDDKGEVSFEYHGTRQMAPSMLLFHGGLKPAETVPPVLLSEIPAYASENNFDARTRLLILRQAQLQTKLSYRNLLPHFTMGTVINGATAGSGLGALAMVGDLAPFLFPSRWILASEHKSLQVAQTWSLMAYRLDAASVTEGLALVYLRDKAVLGIIQEQLDGISKVLSTLEQKENLGLVPEGASDNLRSLILGIKQDQTGLAKMNVIEKNQLAFAMGLVEPRQLSDVRDDSVLKISALTMAEQAELSRAGVAKAPEIKIVEGLIDAARKSAKGRYFNWLDPYADPQGGIGFGTGAYIAIGKTKVSELEVTREQVTATVERKIEDLLGEHALAIESYAAAEENCQIQQRRAERYVRAIETEVNFDDSMLVAALKDYATAKVQLIMSEYSYKSVMSSLRRMSLSGEYEAISKKQNRGALLALE